MKVFLWLRLEKTTKIDILFLILLLFIIISPLSTFSKPLIHLSNVDLPIPDGPIIDTISPSSTSKENLSNIFIIRVLQCKYNTYF